jgi:hypothetical protein
MTLPWDDDNVFYIRPKPAVIRNAVLAYLNATAAKQATAERTLLRVCGWKTLPPLSFVKKLAELYAPRPSLPAPVRLYHRTSTAAAKAILAKGFRDSEGTHGTTEVTHGVWLSDVPLSINEGAKGDTLLCVTLTCDGERIEEFEWVEVGKPYREWQIPAATLKSLISDVVEACPDDQARYRR